MNGTPNLYEFTNSLIALPEMGWYDYEWDEFKSFYDPNARIFYWAEMSGCSCNDWYENVESVENLNFGRKDEFLRAAAEYAGSRYSEEFEEIRRAVKDLT